MDPFVFHRQLADRTARAPRKVAQLPARAAQVATADPGETPYEVIAEESILRLRRYDPAAVDGSARADESPIPIVIVYPFINDPSILDFRPDRSVIRCLLERGAPVYVLEWLDASPIDRSIGLDDVVARYLHRFVDVAREDADSTEVHLHGYSTGAPLAAAYAALHPERIRTLVLQGPPLDFDAGGGVGLLRLLAAHLPLETLVESFDAVPPPVVEGAFTLRKPVEYAATNPARLWDRLDDEGYVEDFARRLAWTADGPAVPGTFYREFVERLLLENRLIRNELRVDGRRVDVGSLAVPVLLVLGREDEFVPREASVPFLDVLSSDDTETLDLPTGHVGLSIAPEAHEQGWPSVYEWLEART